MTLNVSLSPYLEAFVRQQVDTGCYQSASEVVRTALRLLEEQSRTHEARMSWLKQEIDKGLASGPSDPVSKEYWEKLRGKLRDDASSNRDNA